MAASWLRDQFAVPHHVVPTYQDAAPAPLHPNHKPWRAQPAKSAIAIEDYFQAAVPKGDAGPRLGERRAGYQEPLYRHQVNNTVFFCTVYMYSTLELDRWSPVLCPGLPGGQEAGSDLASRPASQPASREASSTANPPQPRHADAGSRLG